MTNKYPRVLHCGYQPIGSPTNSGITLGSMFADWPRDRLAQICMRGHDDVKDDSVLVAPLSIAPVDGLARAILGTRVPAGAIDGLNHAVDRRGISRPLKERLRTGASVLNDLGPTYLPKEVRRYTGDFRPEVVHSLMGSVRAMRLALKLSRRYDVPVVPHFMDDWPSTLYSSGQALGLARRETLRTLDQVIERSPVLLAIGQDMAEEYTTRFDRPTTVVGNSAPFPTTQSAQTAVHGPRVLTYVGGLHLGRDRLIESVAAAMGASHHSWELMLHVPGSDSARADSLAGRLSNVTNGGSLQAGAVTKALADADVLLFIESEDPAIQPFTRLSVSTKVPQYLASGRPVLAVGPPDQASMLSLRRGQRAITVSPSSGNLASALDAAAEITGDPPDDVAAEVRELFDSSATRERLREALIFARNPHGRDSR